MRLRIRDAKNVTAAWLSMLAHFGVGFLLSPFILHRLGDDAFGVWILVFSLTGYYGLLDLGLRQSVIYHVAKFSATGDEIQLCRYVNTSLFSYGILSFFVLLATGLCVHYLPALFRIPPSLLHTTRLVTLVVGAGVAMTFPLSVFAGILAGLQEFYRLHTAQIVSTFLRGLLVVTVLMHGGGLVGIAIVTVGLNVLAYAVLILMIPQGLRLRFGLQFIDKKAWNSIRHYSSLAFLIITADKLRFQSDAIVIGMLASASAVTYFAVGAKLVEYSGFLVVGLSQIFAPMSSQFEATGNVQNLRKVLVFGNRACAMIIFPICTVLIVLGNPIIEVWVGAKYLTSYPVLLLLLLPRTLYLAQAGSVKVLLGTGRHRALAFVLALEGIANLALSLVLVRTMGILGVALGTAIPLTYTSLFFIPRHVCNQLNVRLSDYLKETFLLPIGVCAPLVIVLLSLRLTFPAHHYSGLVLQVAAGGMAYLAGFLLVLRSSKPFGSGRAAIKIRPIGQESVDK